MSSAAINGQSNSAQAPSSAIALSEGILAPTNANTTVPGKMPTCVVHQNVVNGILLHPAPTPYAPLVPGWGLMALVFGVLLAGIDTPAGMPPSWMLGEVVFLACAGAAVLLLQWRSAER